MNLKNKKRFLVNTKTNKIDGWWKFRNCKRKWDRNNY